MSEIILRDIDAVLLGRVKRVADAHGWSLQAALLNIVEQGLFVCEGELSRTFDDADSRALQDAIAAMESVPDDQGFAHIGRADGTAAESVRVPDQSIRQDLFPNTAPRTPRDDDGR